MPNMTNYKREKPRWHRDQVEIYFPAHRIAQIYDAASAWIKKKQESGMGENVKKVTDKHSDFDIIRRGLLGEIAFEMKTGLPADIKAYKSGDKVKDFVSPTGVKIEVKTSRGFLIFNTPMATDFLADVVVHFSCIPGDWERIWLQGWVTRKQFFERAEVRNFGHFDQLSVNPHLLNSPYTLDEIGLSPKPAPGPPVLIINGRKI